MSSAGSLSELDALRSQVADLSRQLAERDRSAQHQREQSDLLRAIIEGTAAETGDAFFSALVTHLTSVLHIKYAFIGEVQGDHIKKIRTLAVSAGGAIVDNFEYALADTPCATALTQGFACFARGLQTMFPQFQRAADLGAESYCAVPLRTKGEAIMGLLVVMDTKPWQQGDDLRSLLEVFVPRIAAEFERRRAEQERAQALADLHNVIETIPDIVFALDTQGNVVKWNRRLGDVTGYSPAELWNKPALAFVPPEEQARTAAAIQRVFVEGYAELEGHLLTKERRLIPYHWTGALLKNTHGEPIGITGIGRDVSDKKRAEEALRESEHRFALAVEGSSDILWDALRLSGEPWYAPQTQIWWSPRVRELLGLQASDSFETLEQWAARLHPDDKDRVFGQLAAHIEQRVPYDVEYRLRTNTGDYRWIRGRGQALWDEQGEPRRMSGSCQDITKRKGVEEALRVSEERWQLAVRGSNDGIWDWDIQSGTVFFSPRWKAMRGFGEYEISSHVEEWRSRIHPDDLGRVLQSLDAYMAKQTPDFCEEYRTQRKDGSYMWILDRGLALWAEDGTPLRMVGSESDITEHKQALLRLAEQESLLRSILDTEPECVNRVADDGTILQMNKAGLCFIEADSFEQVAGRSVFDLVAPEFLERYRRMHEAVIRGASQPLEFQIVGLKGTRRWMETHAVPLRNPIDHRTEHLAITRDITHRKRTETALRESEERYRTLVDLSPNGVLVYSNGKKVYVNQAACRIMGAASPEQLLENPTFHFSHPDDHASIHDSIAQILATGEPVRRVERKYQRLDGTAIFVEVDAGRIMWNGEPAIQVIFADITERKQAEEALRKSEAQFRALAESTTDWMWEIDEQGCFTYCSPKIQDILGYEPNHALGKTPFDFMPEEEARRVVGLFGPIAAARKPFAGIENTNRHKDGRLVILECRGTPVFDDNGLFRGYRGFDQDITERKRVEEERQKQEVLIALMLNTGPACIKRVAANGSLLHMNPTGLTLIEACGEAEVVGRSVFDLITPEHRDAFISMHRRVIEGHECMLQFEVQGLKGIRRWMESYAVPFRNPVTGQMEQLAVTHDITERKQAEKALHESEAFNISVLNSLSSQIVVLNSRGVIMAVNKPWLRFAEENEASHLVENFVGMNYLNVCAQAPLFAHGEEAASAQAGILAVLAGTQGEFSLEYPCHSPDQQRWFRMRVTPLLDSQAGVVVAHENITERKLAEEGLRASEERLRLSLEAANQGIYDLNVQTGEALVSSGYVTMLDYDPATFRETNAAWIERLHPDDRERVADYYRAYVAGEIPEYRVEFRQRRRGGDWRWILSLGRIVERDVRGEPLRMLGTHTDITERKQAEENLRMSEERLQIVARATNDVVWDWDLNTDAVEWNQGFQSLFGYKSEDIEPSAQSWYSRLHPDDRERVTVEIHAAIGRGEHFWSDEYRFLRADRSYAHIFDRGYILYDSAKKPNRMIGSMQDITERKQAEEALRTSEERFDLAVRGSNTGIWDWDLRTHKTYFSPLWKSMLGYEEHELKGEFFEWEERLHPDDRDRSSATVRSYLDGTTPQYELEHRLRHKDGSYRWILARGVSICDTEGKPYRMAGSHIDITELKQTQDALAQRERQLQTVLDALPVGVWFTDRAGKPLLANPAAKQMWSNVKQIGVQVTGNQSCWRESIGPVSEPPRWVLSQVLTTGVPSLNEILGLEGVDGTKKFIRNSTVPIQDEAGNILGAVVLNEDVTMLRQAQAALQMTQFSIDHAIEGFFWIGPDAGIFHVNDAACRMLEYSREELTAMTVHDIDPNFSPEAWPTHWAELKRKGSLTFESKYWSRTGRVLDTEVTVNYLQYEEKEYSCAIMRDIEPRKRADAALRASEERYRSLYDETPTMYFTLATDGRVRSVNRFGAEQLGYQAEELIGHSVLGFYHEEDKETVAASLSECLATPEIARHWEFRKIRKDGTVIWVQETARVSQSSTGETVVLVTCEDITERKRAEQESHERILQVSAMQASLLELAHLDDTSLPFSTILPHVTRIVADVLAVERVSMWLLSGDQTELVCQDLYMRSQATHSAGSRLATSSYPRYLAVLKKSLMIGASNARVDQRTSEFADDYFLSLGITSVLDVPIRRQGKVIGVLWCEHVGMPREWASEVQDFGASVGQTIARMIEASERKRAEISLRQSEERYRSLVDNAPIGIFVIEAGRFVYANREMQRILNATRAEQLLGMPVLDRIAPEFHSVGKDRIHQLIEKGQPVPSLDSQYVRLDGSRIDVAVTAIPTSFDGTDVIQVLVLDIAERKQAEQEQNRLIEDLTRSRQHFQALFNLTPSAVGISTVAEGRFIDVNEGFSRLTGYMREEVMGRTTLELGLWADVSERESVLREIQEQGYLHNQEGLLRTKSGEIRSLMVSVESIQLGSTPCLIYLCHDITERKRMEDALRARERELQSALQERERISQDLHDGILQSLFGVGLNLEVTKSLMPQKTRKTAGGSLDKSIDQLNRVMREIRNFIAGLDSESFEGKDLPAALKHLLESLTENQPTRVRFAVEDRAAKALSAEQSLHLFRVIQEAVSNCIRHGHAQEARVSLKLLKQGVRLRIRDDGRGFSQDTVKTGGYGLRNMAARAKKIGGRFTVLSKENEGTRIILDLPKEAPHFPR